MTDDDTTIYENHLKKAYFTSGGRKHLAITDTSCYHLGEETCWLIAGLPDSGGKELYLNSLSGLGLDAPQKIFDRLVSISVLQEKKRRSWKDVLGIVLTPKIKLLSAQFQEKFFGYFITRPAAAAKIARALAAISAVGLVWSILLVIAGPTKALPVHLAGQAGGLTSIALVIAGSLVHELGHSFAAMAAGIGLRPIGFSVYLVYPVFYTNVSGIEKTGLAERVLIDCGGFIFQGVFLFVLLLACSVTASPTLAEAARWIAVIVFFNLNPLFRTDGYWLYKDVYSEFKVRRWARALHYLYLSAFVAFSAWFLWRVGGRLGDIWRGLNTLLHSPGYFFSGGYRVILAAYFVLVGLSGGLRRFKEGHQEWKELQTAASGETV